MTVDNFDEGRTTCKRCLADKRTSYYTHQNKYNGAQRKSIKKIKTIEKKEGTIT